IKRMAHAAAIEGLDSATLEEIRHKTDSKPGEALPVRLIDDPKGIHIPTDASFKVVGTPPNRSVLAFDESFKQVIRVLEKDVGKTIVDGVAKDLKGGKRVRG